MVSMLYILCTTLPSHIIAFTQYWDYPWRSKKLALLLVSINVLVKTMTVSWIIQNGGNIRLVELLFSVAGTAIYIFTIRVRLSKLLFTYVLVVDYLTVVRGIGSFLGNWWLGAGFQAWETSLICIITYILTLPWLLHFFRKSARQVFQINAPSLWRIIWIPPALTTIIVILYTNAFDGTSATDWKSFLARLSLLGCTMVAYFVLIQTLEELQSRAALEEQNRQAQYILSLQRTQYASLQSHMEEIRRARHDLRQHQRIINSFLDSGNEDELRAYLQTQKNALPSDGLRLYCKNYPVNLLLNHYAGRFSEIDIDFEFQVELPVDLKSAEPDVCVIIGNLLENALDACSSQQEPYVRAVTRLTGKSGLTIIVDNTAPIQPQRKEDGTLLSSKPFGGGIGTQSIQYIAHQYGGRAEFQWENGMFLASVFINLPEDTGSPIQQKN